MVLCPNCHCDIEDSKMILHQRFCIQNIKYCEQCKEGIIIEEYEEHCKNHNKKEEKQKSQSSQESKDSLTLSRVQSSKIGCQYCGYFCGFDELEEHEAMCGAKSTTCKQCKKKMLVKDLRPHIEKVHNLKMENYEEMKSSSLGLEKEKSINNNSSHLFGNFDNLDLQRMTSDEEIAYALALSQEEEQRKKQEEQKKNNIKEDKKIKSNIEEKNSDYKQKKSEKIDYDEMEYEYEKQLYEDEMNNFQ